MRGLILAAVAALALAGCAGSAGADSCGVGIEFDPAMPVVGQTIRANAVVLDVPGVLQYDWTVTLDGDEIPHQDAQSDGRDITFTAASTGVYEVSLGVSGSSFCPTATSSLTVLAEDPNQLHVRLRVTPSTGSPPPLEKRLTINGDVDLGPVVLDPGVRAVGSVTAGNVGIAAYLKFMPVGNPEAAVETYSTGTGAFDVTVLDQTHDVVVIPAGASLAPGKILGWNPGQPIALPAGTPISGLLVDPNLVAIANAKVQLTIDGVPSTTGTTAADGTFTVLAVIVPGKQVKVEVTPPAATGLPRLEATDLFDLFQPLSIGYASAVTSRDLAGVHVRRGGVAQPNAQVTIVGTIAGVGRVATGGVLANATGVVRITTTADAGGALPALNVPALPLTAVIATAPADLAVTALDLTSGVPANLVASPMAAIASLGRDLGGVGVPGVVLELVPQGALADAGAPSVQRIGDATGAITGVLAAGGHYDARWIDPSGLSGPRLVGDLTAATLAASYVLPKSISVSGTLSVFGAPNPIHGAAVQLLCGSCSGVARDRPIAEVASDRLGRFELILADQGTM